MTERVRKLREQSLNVAPHISAERALLLTAFEATVGFHSAPVKRALAFKAIMEHKQVCVNPGELIVGERGPSPKATYTYPELCCHSLEDLAILDTREKIWFRVDAETREAYQGTVIPAWRGRTMRE